ncbi:MAG: MFS transporter, partial [Promethearchaeota archaeon]
MRSQQQELSFSKEALEIEAEQTNSKNVLLWGFGSAISGIFRQGLLSITFVTLGIFLGMQEGFTFFWSFVALTIVLGISNLLVIIIGPFIGALSDSLGKRKSFMIIFSGISVVLLATIATWLNFWLTATLFIFGNCAYQLGRIVYDAQVLFNSATKDRGKTFGISGVFDSAASLIAVVISLVILFIFGSFSNLSDVQSGLIAASELNFGGLRWMFPICAGLMLLFLVPYFFSKDKEKGPQDSKPNNGSKKKTIKKAIKESISELKDSFYGIVNDKNMILFLIGWFFISTGIAIITVYILDITKRITLIEDWQALMVLATIAIAALISSYITGIFIGEIGPKIAFIFNIANVILGMVLSTVANYKRVIIITEVFPSGLIVKTIKIFYVDWWVIYIGTFFIGLAIGGFWVIGKQFLIEIAPPRKVGQYFGFKEFITQLGAVFAPLLFFGLISRLNDKWS